MRNQKASLPLENGALFVIPGVLNKGAFFLADILVASRKGILYDWDPAPGSDTSGLNWGPGKLPIMGFPVFQEGPS